MGQSIHLKGSDANWLLYLTSLNYILVTSYFVVGTCVTLHFVLSGSSGQSNLEVPPSNTDPELYDHPSESDISTPTSLTPVVNFDENSTKYDLPGTQMRWYLKVYFFLFSLVICTCTFVVFTFWTVLFPRVGSLKGFTRYESYLLVDRHGINLILIMIEFTFNSHPVRFLHFIYTALFLLMYIIYNLIYWSESNRLIYGDVLNYGKYPGFVVALIASTVFLVLPIIQLLWYGAFRLRRRIAKKLSLNDKSDDFKPMHVAENDNSIVT